MLTEFSMSRSRMSGNVVSNRVVTLASAFDCHTFWIFIKRPTSYHGEPEDNFSRSNFFFGREIKNSDYKPRKSESEVRCLKKWRQQEKFFERQVPKWGLNKNYALKEQRSCHCVTTKLIANPDSDGLLTDGAKFINPRISWEHRKNQNRNLEGINLMLKSCWRFEMIHRHSKYDLTLNSYYLRQPPGLRSLSRYLFTRSFRFVFLFSVLFLLLCALHCQQHVGLAIE